MDVYSISTVKHLIENELEKKFSTIIRIMAKVCGSRVKLASKIKVSPATITRWANDSVSPSKRKLDWLKFQFLEIIKTKKDAVDLSDEAEDVPEYEDVRGAAWQLKDGKRFYTKDKFGYLLGRGDTDFALIVRLGLKICRLTENELADKVDVSPTTVSRWKTGLSEPDNLTKEVVKHRFKDFLVSRDGVFDE